MKNKIRHDTGYENEAFILFWFFNCLTVFRSVLGDDLYSFGDTYKYSRLLLRKKGKKLFLQAENQAYSPIEITEDMDFQIWGIVSYAIHKF